MEVVSLVWCRKQLSHTWNDGEEKVTDTKLGPWTPFSFSQCLLLDKTLGGGGTAARRMPCRSLRLVDLVCYVPVCSKKWLEKMKGGGKSTFDCEVPWGSEEENQLVSLGRARRRMDANSSREKFAKGERMCLAWSRSSVSCVTLPTFSPFSFHFLLSVLACLALFLV